MPNDHIWKGLAPESGWQNFGYKVDKCIKQSVSFQLEQRVTLMSPICNCVSSGYKENGPYYVHLGHHKTQEGLRKKFEESLGVSGEELRMVTILFTGKEGKTSEDCPIAKWILQRPCLHEKYLVVVKEQYKHFCD